MKRTRFFFFPILLAFSLSACQTPFTGISQPALPAASTTASVTATTAPQPSPTSTQTPTASPTSTNTAPQTFGPEAARFPAGYNPLTGQPADDPATLDLPAVLVSITNFPPSARPQAGLSFSPWVYEFYISEGMTRFLATFYGGFPSVTSNSSDTAAAVKVGPVRSGRLSYIPIRDFYQGSCLVYAGATAQIRDKLRGCAIVYASDPKDINSAMLDVSQMQKIAGDSHKTAGQFDYSGNLFTSAAPNGGEPANKIGVYYSYLNQAQWQFDPASGNYLKFTDFADGSGKFTPATDRLTGDQLAFANVIVLFSPHIVLHPYIIDVKMGAKESGPAVIFRDGKMYKATWTTAPDAYEKATGLRHPMRLVDANGQPFPLKPGHTWVHVVTPASQVLEEGTGDWSLRFYAPAGAK